MLGNRDVDIIIPLPKGGGLLTRLKRKGKLI